MKITNVSDRPREIAATGQNVDPGGTVEVDKKLGTSLCRQTRVWGEVKPSSKTKNSRKTTEKSKPETGEEGDR